MEDQALPGFSPPVADKPKRKRGRARWARRASLHPILKAVRKRQIEISKLLATARMLDIDVSPVLPKPPPPKSYRQWRDNPEKAAAYFREMAEELYAPLPPTGADEGAEV
jgi:hypothetical protein